MNREERRREQKERFEHFWKHNYFARTGTRLFFKTTGRNLDIPKLVNDNFNSDSLSKHNKQINAHPEFNNPNATNIYDDITKFNNPDDITNEVTSMMFSMPGDASYPYISIRNKKLLAMLGIKNKKSRFGYIGGLLLYYQYLIRVILRLAKDIRISVRQDRDDKTFRGTPLHYKVNYIFSRSIAHRHGHDKGRQRNPHKHQKDDNIQAAFVRREVRLDTEESDDTELDTEGSDYAIPADTERIETEQLYQQFRSIIQQQVVDTADQLTIRTQILADQARIPFETAFSQYQDDFNKLGIHSARAAKKRLRYLPNKYPDLKVIQESHKR